MSVRLCVSVLVCARVCVRVACRFILLIQGQFLIMQSEYRGSCYNICLNLLHVYVTDAHVCTCTCSLHTSNL